MRSVIALRSLSLIIYTPDLIIRTESKPSRTHMQPHPFTHPTLSTKTLEVDDTMIDAQRKQCQVFAASVQHSSPKAK